ncbi:AMP-dependent synthetase/ligase [Macleaya cordata]|uniref:AMP-dependent synthetase/ligase n=1 Tax=Macleaya cordata TaxID=56857 RepID=A0A200R4B0_MACCD|nr:AMP-dependent synthetase/ligase [Macleaya cordata]
MEASPFSCILYLTHLPPNPKSGFCSETKTYFSLDTNIIPLPPQNAPLSISDFIFSLFHSSASGSSSGLSTTTTAALIDSVTGDRISYSEFINQVESLAFSLQTQIGLSKGDTAFILSPAIPQISILYFSLFSLGVVISPSNPTCSVSEISHQFNLSKPAIAFATSKTAHKLIIPSLLLRYPIILLDSPEFNSMMTNKTIDPIRTNLDSVEVSQSDTAAILYSSGTTGRVKGVMLSHRNLISIIAGLNGVLRNTDSTTTSAVLLCTVPFFHIFGFVVILKAVAMGETLVVLTADQRFDVRRMMKSVGDFKVTHVAVAPPVVLAMTKGSSDDLVVGMSDYDLSSLKAVICAGAPLAMEVIARFRERYPNVVLSQGYGLTEAAGVFQAAYPDVIRRYGSVGRLGANFQAKVVDPETGAALPPCKQGELWVKGPTIMKGYVGEEEATTAILDSDGWLRTGDLCYIDNDGFLFVIDRLKELIKYKGYQVPPAELEELLQSNPDILDAAVIPYPNEEVGEVPMAFVVRRPRSSIDESQVMDFIAKQVAPYKKIRKVAFIDSIPKNAPGKILRKELIRLALSSRPTAKL